MQSCSSSSLSLSSHPVLSVAETEAASQLHQHRHHHPQQLDVQESQSTAFIPQQPPPTHTHTQDATPTQNQTSQTGSNSRQRTAAKSVSSCCQSSSVRKDTQIHLKAQKFIGIRTRQPKPTTISIAAIRISLSAFLFIPTDKIQGFSVASVFVSCRRPFKHQEHKPLTPQALHDELATGLDQI